MIPSRVVQVITTVNQIVKCKIIIIFDMTVSGSMISKKTDALRMFIRRMMKDNLSCLKYIYIAQILFAVSWCVSAACPLAAAATPENIFQKYLGENDSIVVTDAASDTNLVRVHEDALLIPASTLKLFTALVAIHVLGKDYHFHTDFYVDNKNNLTIKGFGDPSLISEIIPDIAEQVGRKVTEINDIILDDTYFQTPVFIPGITADSTQPYDAPNGALCVNFNTVFFKKNGHGRYISAEPQTPLLPFILNRINAASMNQGRIILSHENQEYILYAGHLFRYFLSETVPVSGTVHQGAVDPRHDTRVLRYHSPYSLQDIIQKMLYYSNNFTANQLLIAAGASQYGTPGTLAKGVQAAKAFAADNKKLTGMQLQEGSGISRGNRVSASMMDEILKLFFPYRHLLKQGDRELFKTGTLTGIRTRAGYLETRNGKTIRYVVMLNSGRNRIDRIMKLLYRFY